MTAILKVDTIQDTSGNNIINENAGTVTIGKAGNTTNIVGTLQNDGAALISGITMAQQWRLTANLVGDANPISSNLISPVRVRILKTASSNLPAVGIVDIRSSNSGMPLRFILILPSWGSRFSAILMVPLITLIRAIIAG